MRTFFRQIEMATAEACHGSERRAFMVEKMEHSEMA
jgi:hypothetical protein